MPNFRAKLETLYQIYYVHGVPVIVESGHAKFSRFIDNPGTDTAGIQPGRSIVRLSNLEISSRIPSTEEK